MADIETQKMISFLSQKWGEKKCNMCGGGTWEVQDKVFQLTEFHQGNLVVGGPLVPVVPVTCTNCGNTTLVNALISGAITPEPNQGEKP